MPPATANLKSIRDYFRPSTVRQNHESERDHSEDEIIVRPSKPPASPEIARSHINREPLEESHRSSNPREKSRECTGENAGANVVHHGGLDGVSDKLITVPPDDRNVRSPSLPSRIAPAASQTLTTSFSSLTSLATSSQSSSRRVLKDGMLGVLNSSSCSEGSEESEDELQDVQTFFPRKKPRLTPPPPEGKKLNGLPTTQRAGTRHSSRLSRVTDRPSSTITSRMPPSPPLTSSKSSFIKLMRQVERQQKDEARIQEMEQNFEQQQQLRAERLRDEKKSEGGLRDMVADPSNDVDRMKLAIERTEALKDNERMFYFHGLTALSADARGEPPHLDATVKWKDLVANQHRRTQTFVSGLMAEIASNRDMQLPLAFCEWMCDQLRHEAREDLCAAIVETLVSCQARPNDVVCAMDRLSYFYQMAEDHQTNRSNESALHTNKCRALINLEHVLCVVRHHSSITPSIQRKAWTLAELALANVDENVKVSPSLQGAVQDAIEYILKTNISDGDAQTLLEETMKTFFSSFPLSLASQCRVACALPAGSERSHELRRQMAMHIIACRTTEGVKSKFDKYTKDLRSPDWINVVLSRLKNSPEFRISDSVNYSLLDALVSTLDPAIDVGFSDFAFFTACSKANTTKITVPFAKSSAIMQAETSFNTAIDALTAQLTRISSRIRDAGTSHLRRAEAKSALERLIARLEYGVRTRPKPRVGMFGDVMDDQKAFLSAFLKRDENASGNDVVNLLPDATFDKGNGHRLKEVEAASAEDSAVIA